MSKDLAASQAEAARKFAQAMSAQPPARMRPMEAVWILICFVLLAAYLQKSDVSAQVIADKAKLAECEIAKERARQYATALTALLNEKPIVIGETTRVSCKVREIPS
jgi:hypothetical protein